MAHSTSIVPDAENSVFRIRLTSESSQEASESKTLHTPLEKSTGSTKGAEGITEGIKGAESAPSIDSHDGISEAQMQGTEPGSQQLTLTLSDSSHLIMVREYFFDSEPRQPSRLTIKRLGVQSPYYWRNYSDRHIRSEYYPFEARAANAVNFLIRLGKAVLRSPTHSKKQRIVLIVPLRCLRISWAFSIRRPTTTTTAALSHSRPVRRSLLRAKCLQLPSGASPYKTIGCSLSSPMDNPPRSRAVKSQTGTDVTVFGLATLHRQKARTGSTPAASPRDWWRYGIYYLITQRRQPRSFSS